MQNLTVADWARRVDLLRHDLANAERRLDRCYENLDADPRCREAARDLSSLEEHVEGLERALHWTLNRLMDAEDEEEAQNVV